ncbi:MAG: response regulator [Flavobacteriales bacterium]|nr:response regulator [Flavobacteriales bacterium]
MDSKKVMKNALLVDDEREICELLAAILHRAGMRCHFAHSLAGGRASLTNATYDAVFVDVNLPDGLGYELISEARAIRPGVPCIAISAIDTERGRAMAAGADVFIAKPFSREAILSSIRDLGFSTTKPPST